MRRIFAIGETVLDIIFRRGQPQQATPGGSALNTAVSLGRMGMDVFFISEYGQDRVGEMVDEMLQRNGVATSHVFRFPGRTSLALAFLDADGNASYDFYKQYPENRLDIRFPEPTADDLIVFGSFYGIDAAIHRRIKPWLQEARAKGALILYDPNFRASHLPELAQHRPVMLDNFSMADIVKGSSDDFRYIFGADDSVTAWKHIRPLCAAMLYTDGASNLAFHRGDLHESFAVPALQPVSTIGAGDNFNAGLLYALVTCGLHASDIEKMPSPQRKTLVDTGIRFAQEVCLQQDNYVSEEFARRERASNAP